MDLIKIADSISDKYVKSNVDMNDSIAKYASENNLSIHQTKRLVEESNQSCYLKKLAATGEQVFDIADFEKIKTLMNKINTPQEKIASINFDRNDYSQSEELQKTAETNEDLRNINEAIIKCNSLKSDALIKVAKLQKQISPYINFESSLDLSKVAEISTIPTELANEFKEALNKVSHYEQIAQNLLEKKAGVITTVAGGALKAGGKAIGFVAQKPLKRGLNPIMYGQTFKMGAKKAAGEEVNKVVSNMADVTSLPKVASFGSSIAEAAKIAFSPETLKQAAPWLLAAGAIGVTASAARGMGGIASRMMNERELNESFNTVMQANKDLRDIPGVRGYFDVIARHAPDLAKDPLVAPQLIRNFETFGGVDINTVAKMREIQNKFGPQFGERKKFDLLGSASSLQSLTQLNKPSSTNKGDSISNLSKAHDAATANVNQWAKHFKMNF